jgi:hypothetical protein
MTHKETRANADKLAELCRIMEVYSREISDTTEAGQMLKRYLPRIEELSGQLSFDVRNLIAENRMLSERLHLVTEEADRRAHFAECIR